MKIQIGDIVLCGRVPEESHSELRIEPVAEIQTYGALRAKAKKAKHRGNVLTRISFTVTRQHADLLAAEQFLLEHETEIPDEGTVTLTSSGSGRSVTRYLPDAALQRPKGRHVGASTIHEYEILGGRITSTKP